ncbi:hypothetical protein [Rhizobium skierniewicense]|uniref:hypothetical protein n=1 Tax=Rhizobium skierniewicense TaxID=984260 RepID=UPI001573949D|nr:hypothetical protein [Rhizobium skierniewicense]NTF32324.1 hypothetical protein [Rhizobium skierniewicense]
MSIANVFGKEFELTPAVFQALPEHGKAELCRLLREIGWPLMKILRFCGLKTGDFNDLYYARHSFDMGDQTSATSEDPVTAKQKDDVTDRLSIHHCRLLVRFPHSGLAYWKNQRAMEMEAGIKFGDGPKTMEKLYENRLVERAPPRRGFDQCWALTELGTDLRASMNPDDVQSVRKSKS